ncbi:LuxR C-terminal-related transcriptional regulator [Streptomyces uncialis]|uniref:LuxR C-terminal-related transcriptional regulator n=1 Tax=Streptomyces uncialis TaxID=1048205 RepID=UPI0038634BD2|nr:LuxR C-terminal-related transcriptional regulator [Streptomyces uncialis]
MNKLPPRLSVITLGAWNMPRLRGFYRRLGWTELPPGADGPSGFLLGGVLLALRPMAEVTSGAPGEPGAVPGWSGVTLTCAVDSSRQVDAVFAAAVNVGAAAVAAPADRPSGGRSACIADPEGNRWEIAWGSPTEESAGGGTELGPPGGELPTWCSPLDPAGTHRATAELLHHRGAPDEEVAAHLVAAGGSGPGWATETLLSAAHTARRKGRPGQAVDILRRALAEPLPPGRRGGALTELGCLEVTLGPEHRASGVRHLAESIRLEEQSDAGVFKAANALGATLAARGQTSIALDVMEELSERFTGHPELARAVQGAAALIASHDGHSWLETVGRLRGLAARTSQRPAPAVSALLAEFDSTSGRLSAAQAAEVAREVTAKPLEPFSRTYVLASAATLAQWADELALADRLVANGITGHPGPSADPGYQSLLSVRAETLVMRGRYHELLEACGDWGILIEPSTRRAPGGHPNAHLVAQAVIALTETGRTTEARRLADSVTAEASRGSWEWNELLYARGLLSLVEGSPAAALEDLLECGRRQSERQVISPIVTPWRSAAADCQLLLGRTGPAITLASEELEAARHWGTPRCIGRAMRAFGTATGGRAGLAAVEQAVGLLRNTATTPELLSALVAHGRMLTEAGRPTAARQVLREAAQHAERMSAERSRGVVADLLAAAGARRITAPRTGARALTAAERRVCGLAAHGHSNPEIARLLRVALRTVETHLTNSFRKLGVRRRTELAGRLAAEPPAADR